MRSANTERCSVLETYDVVNLVVPALSELGWRTACSLTVSIRCGDTSQSATPDCSRSRNSTFSSPHMAECSMSFIPSCVTGIRPYGHPIRRLRIVVNDEPGNAILLSGFAGSRYPPRLKDLHLEIGIPSYGKNIRDTGIGATVKKDSRV
jgi:hypothetical protein